MSLRTPRMAELDDPATPRELVLASEGDIVERKRTADADALANAIFEFANTRGGWLLLGVDDDGALAGWRPKGEAHALATRPARQPPARAGFRFPRRPRDPTGRLTAPITFPATMTSSVMGTRHPGRSLSGR